MSMGISKGNRYVSTRNGGHTVRKTGPGLVISQRFVSPYEFIPAGKEIYSEGERSAHLYLMIEGWAYQYQMLRDGRRQILDFSLPGTLLGILPGSATKMPHTAESLTGVTVAAIPQRWLREIFAREPDFAMGMVSAAADTINQAYDNLTDVGRRTAYEALARLMLRLYTRVRTQCPGTLGNCVELPLTQAHIGDALGLTSVHVCRTLRTLRRDGVLKLRDGTLTILDFDRLTEIADDRSEVVASPRRDKVAGQLAESIRSAA
jgi:CRP/FNR family transcriptional regulator